MRCLILSADGFEDTELLVPYYRLLEEGHSVDVSSSNAGTITGKHGYQAEATIPSKDAEASDYGLLILPGGRAPEKVRLDKAALEIVMLFFQADKPVAAICHGPQILVSAGVAKGRKMTGWRGILDDLAAAGAVVSDEEVVVDGNLVTSRQPSDLPAFCRETVTKAKNAGGGGGKPGVRTKSVLR
jgi:protease I